MIDQNVAAAEQRRLKHTQPFPTVFHDITTTNQVPRLLNSAAQLLSPSLRHFPLILREGRPKSFSKAWESSSYESFRREADPSNLTDPLHHVRQYSKHASAFPDFEEH